MMVPRTYQYSSPTTIKPTKRTGKDKMATSLEERKPVKISEKKKKAGLPAMFSPSPPTPSKPVVVPTRTQESGRRRERESGSKVGTKDIRTPPCDSFTPSSVAASLAMKALPESEHHYQSNPLRDVSASNCRKMLNAGDRLMQRRTISSSSPQSWGMLLSPPEDLEEESETLGMHMRLGPRSSARSLSTESMPSLETDSESVSSNSELATPASLHILRASPDRRQRNLSTSIGEDCILDHPLLLPNRTDTKMDEEASADDNFSLVPSAPSPLAKSKSYLKSNLTASFRKIRSAAQSVSAFAALPTQREDYLARSLLSIDTQFTDERRPLPSAETPDPALRRYLNPTTFSPAELHFHSEKSPQAAQPKCIASIQLQTYRGRHCGSEHASSPPIFTSSEQRAMDAVDGVPEVSSPRQREPRENSDFLRVIVLEMNMRKVGKLSDTSPGRARLWLPARQIGKMMDEESTVDDGAKVPARWAGVKA